jgi:hypothetical protein
MLPGRSNFSSFIKEEKKKKKKGRLFSRACTIAAYAYLPALIALFDICIL